MKKTIEDFDLRGKRVIIRVDFNVPIENSKITDDNRIKESLKTINYCIEKGSRVILLSHLGRVKKEEDKITNTLEPVSIRLGELLKKKVKFVPYTKGEEVDKAVNNLKEGEVLLLENTRFEDLNGNLESSNDPELAKYWASLGDIFINDAFGTCHREHASNVGIASILPSGVGFLVLKELKMLGKSLANPKRPFTVILGGSKVSDKIKVIGNLVENADYILVGGAMAYTFLKAKGINIGLSLLDEESIDFCENILSKYPDKIILPIDNVVSKKIDRDAVTKNISIDNIDNVEIGLDIGIETIELFKKYLNDSKTIIWNGPVGYFEIEKFSNGTKNICEILKKIDAIKIAGGGDTASSIINFGYKDAFTHISTGGGASLKMLEGKPLKAIEVISDSDE